MKSVKRVSALLLCVVMLLTLAACAGKTSASAGGSGGADGWKWKERVEIVVPSSEGGGLDVTVRKFATYLEKELGVNITILNKADSITSCYTYAHTAENEGYMFQFTAPTSFLVDAAGMFEGFTLRDEIVPVSGLVLAEGVLFSRPNAPWNTAEELIAYMKAHPGEVTCAVDSPTGISGAIVREFEKAADVQFDWITSGASEGFISTIAGDIDTCINTWADAGAYVASGDLKATLVMSQKRNDAFSDVTCAGELGIPSTLGYYRVFTAMKGCPQEAIDALAAAIKKVSENPEWVEWLKANGLTNEYVWSADELMERINATYDAAKGE